MFIGQMTNKIIGFGIAQKRCVQCEVYKRQGLTAFHYPAHHCHKNHWSSSAAMETAIACRLQVEVSLSGARLSVCVGDGDSHINAALNQCPNVDLTNVQRVLDLNHLVRNLFKALAVVKSRHYAKQLGVLDPKTIQHFCTVFTRVVHQHRISPQSQIVPLQCDNADNESNKSDGGASEPLDDGNNHNVSVHDESALFPEGGDIDLDAVKSDETMEEEEAIGSPLKPRQLFLDGEHEDDNDDITDNQEQTLLDLIQMGTQIIFILQFTLIITLAADERQMAPDEFDQIFQDKTNDNPPNHDSNVLDDSLLTNLAFKIPRQKVDALRRSLLNIVPHYFNIHNGTMT